MEPGFNGLVIGMKDINENDRIIYVLTADYGLLEIIAKGIKKSNAKNAAACQLYSYSRFTITARNYNNILTGSEQIRSFYKLSEDMKKYALACYFSEVLRFSIMRNQPSEEILRVVLNCFYMLTENKKSCALIKSIFELRLVCFLGAMPNLIGCAECYKFDADRMFLLYQDGKLLCEDDFNNRRSESAFVEIDRTILHTMRIVCLTELEKCFGFNLKGDSLRKFGVITETYLLTYLDTDFKSLDFYKSLD